MPGIGTSALYTNFRAICTKFFDDLRVFSKNFHVHFKIYFENRTTSYAEN